MKCYRVELSPEDFNSKIKLIEIKHLVCNRSSMPSSPKYTNTGYCYIILKCSDFEAKKYMVKGVLVDGCYTVIPCEI
ncbi:hypothetical protein GCM10007878_25130 [Marinospirillum insulare]|uniref:Uncharacterized protein n=1 Tax=Marinospirillum insulare TaxID=217169 RepID=A0ABQ5ZYM3_9GAMM|nr:hypothetical protein GCM10007878_25130 [Marinospirillum insulare]